MSRIDFAPRTLAPFAVLILMLAGAAGAYAQGSWSILSTSPTARANTALASAGGMLYVIGGNFHGNSSSIGLVESYNPSTNIWMTRAPLPQASQQLSAVQINGTIYAVGGGTATSALNTLQAYNPATNTWTLKAPMPTARYSPVAVVAGGKLYVMSGGSGYGADYGHLVEAYDSVTNTWSTKAPIPTPRHNFGIGVIDGKIYTVGGGIGLAPTQRTDRFLEAK